MPCLTYIPDRIRWCRNPVRTPRNQASIRAGTRRMHIHSLIAALACPLSQWIFMKSGTRDTYLGLMLPQYFKSHVFTSHQTSKFNSRWSKLLHEPYLLTAEIVNRQFFWVVTRCLLVGRFQPFGGAHFSYLQGYQRIYMLSQPRRTTSTSSPLWEPQIFRKYSNWDYVKCNNLKFETFTETEWNEFPAFRGLCLFL
jgi:hypothetical protein